MPRLPGEALLSGFFAWRVLPISVLMMTGNRVALRAIATCVPLQLACTHLPPMQGIFSSADLTVLEWAKVLAASLLVFWVAGLVKAVIRHSPLAARLGRA